MCNAVRVNGNLRNRLLKSVQSREQSSLRQPWKGAKMFKDGQDRYGTYARKKERKPIQTKPTRFFQQRYAWLNWRKVDRGGFSFHLPCLEH